MVRREVDETMVNKYKRMVMGIATAVLLCFIYPATASAHSQLESSVPEDGQTVEESLDTITIHFSGGIEAASTMSLIKDNEEEIALEIEVDGSTLTARVEQPLANGEYEAMYTILSEDTHPVEGAFSFTVATEEESTIEEKPDQTEAPPVEEEQEEAVEAPDQQASDANTESAGLGIGWIIALVAIAGILSGVVMRLVKRKS
ncbi:copper resistance CopC family protein [Alkalicoccobacillus porphyridii]|uniref:Copper resistance protein CopC n=1 Tax=Alkalicoccobacillus porphyridii TaxID=2597270 RepID=A0A554A2F4_9BACI|nr:copper resistance CopC family protein [Alkalicoccobacillus porphyridii]TSB47855.1 copper resistance protein CopC [Alkalicoccobacillus porphyridii]